jgi:hypothetical protein
MINNSSPPDTLQEPKLRGSHAGMIIAWIQEAYGEALFHRALMRLPEEIRREFQRRVLGVGWYPISYWDSLLDAVRAEVRASRGESEEIFDNRHVREAGGRLLSSLYKFVLSWLQPTLVLSRMPTLMGRIYNEGSFEAVENTPGLFRGRYQGPRALYPNVKRYVPRGIVYMLELTGAKQIRLTTPRERVSATTFDLELQITYV